MAQSTSAFFDSGLRPVFVKTALHCPGSFSTARARDAQEVFLLLCQRSPCSNARPSSCTFWKRACETNKGAGIAAPSGSVACTPALLKPQFAGNKGRGDNLLKERALSAFQTAAENFVWTKADIPGTCPRKGSSEVRARFNVWMSPEPKTSLMLRPFGINKSWG